MDESEVIVGRIVRAHGLRGEVVVAPTSPGSDVLFHVEAIDLEHNDGRRRVAVENARDAGRGIALRLQGIPDRTAAEKLVGAQIVLKKSELPPPDEDEVYVDSLIGMDVVSPTGEALGRVVDFEDAGIQAWLVVDTGRTRALVPFTEPLVDVDVKARRIVLDAPEGLLDPEKVV